MIKRLFVRHDFKIYLLEGTRKKRKMDGGLLHFRLSKRFSKRALNKPCACFRLSSREAFKYETMGSFVFSLINNSLHYIFLTNWICIHFENGSKAQLYCSMNLWEIIGTWTYGLNNLISNYYLLISDIHAPYTDFIQRC